jgi:hypothetical protein
MEVDKLFCVPGMTIDNSIPEDNHETLVHDKASPFL